MYGVRAALLIVVGSHGKRENCSDAGDDVNDMLQNILINKYG